MKKILLLTTCLLGGLVAADAPDNDQTGDRSTEIVVPYQPTATGIEISTPAATAYLPYASMEYTDDNLQVFATPAASTYLPYSSMAAEGATYDDFAVFAPKPGIFPEFTPSMFEHLQDMLKNSSSLSKRVRDGESVPIYLQSLMTADGELLPFKQVHPEATLVFKVYVSQATSLLNPIVNLVAEYHADAAYYRYAKRLRREGNNF